MKIETLVEDNIVILKPQGEMINIYDQEPRLHGVVKDHIEKGYRKYILYLDQVSFIDSSGIGDIVASYVSWKENRCEFVSVVTKKRIKMIFHVTMFDKFLKLLDSIEEAKENLSPY